MQEIERKFLVISEKFKEQANRKTLFVQAYLNTDPLRTIRVRISGEQAFLTVKGKSTQNGLSRFEWEKEIDKEEAKALIDLCEPGRIEKYRYFVPVGEHTFEVDEFLGDNKGLVLAEVELSTEDEKYERPDWLGEEVTGNLAYYNSKLITQPYKDWN